MGNKGGDRTSDPRKTAGPAAPGTSGGRTDLSAHRTDARMASESSVACPMTLAMSPPKSRLTNPVFMRDTTMSPSTRCETEILGVGSYPGTSARRVSRNGIGGHAATAH